MLRILLSLFVLIPNLPRLQTVAPAPARTAVRPCPVPLPARWLIRGMSANLCLKKDDTCRAAASPSGAAWQSRPPQNPHSQYLSCHPHEMAAPAIPPETQTISPYRIAWSADNGYLQARYWDEKLSTAPPAEVAGSCARKISWCGRMDRNPIVPNRWTRPPLPPHYSASPPPQPCSHD